MRRVASLENRVQVKVEPGPDAVIRADPDQLEQMLINLVRNAADSVIAHREAQGRTGAMANASGEAEPPIIISWSLCDNTVVITIADRGPGLMNPENAFVPFYTTKQNGSGIGLILSRQICEAHGGSLELGNRAGQPGCIAKIVLPRS
jgi:signal transduction histidine kinase